MAYAHINNPFLHMSTFVCVSIIKLNLQKIPAICHPNKYTLFLHYSTYTFCDPIVYCLWCETCFLKKIIKNRKQISIIYCRVHCVKMSNNWNFESCVQIFDLIRGSIRIYTHSYWNVFLYITAYIYEQITENKCVSARCMWNFFDKIAIALRLQYFLPALLFAPL